jgi:hypothetical protein
MIWKLPIRIIITPANVMPPIAHPDTVGVSDLGSYSVIVRLLSIATRSGQSNESPD